ncbi:MAG: PLP-dependent aspartate aminotransferase family protein [Sutterellaceae bacterium]|nr:PLP-dependent aspartate aminotransferase family protein [Sutterellaceae bacterium]
MKQFLDFRNQPFASLSQPVWRGSTVVFDSFGDFVKRKSRQPDGYSFGLTGTPTARELEHEVAELEHGKHCVVFPSGQSALMSTVMAFVRGGDHILVSDSCYGALKTFSSKWLAKMGVEVEFFPPAAGGELEERFRANTRMICMESPGTVTMEMQDVDAICSAARRHGIRTMIDNTWASPLFFRPLEHGVDFAIESGTKMLGGHSDLLLGAVTTNSDPDYAALRETQSILGAQACPDDCFLVLRGMQTLEVRMERQSESTNRIAHWVAEQPEVKLVLCPALETDPGYGRWKKNYTGCGPLFSFVFRDPDEKALGAFFDSLRCFKIGASWGGTHSLVGYYPASQQQARNFTPTRDPIVRVAIGIQKADVLIDDLARAFRAWKEALG